MGICYKKPGSEKAGRDKASIRLEMVRGCSPHHFVAIKRGPVQKAYRMNGRNLQNECAQLKIIPIQILLACLNLGASMLQSCNY